LASRSGTQVLIIYIMIGSGMFSLPQNVASGASAAVLICWLITGAG
jgi:arginine:ornithine antiporter/lysine permease